MRAKKFSRFCTNCGQPFETSLWGAYHCPRCKRKRPMLRVSKRLQSKYRKSRK